MAKKNGHTTEETLEKILAEMKSQTAALTKEMRNGFATVGDRVSALANGTGVGLARLETRLDEIAKNTGTHHRELESRLRVVEIRLGIEPPPEGR